MSRLRRTGISRGGSRARPRRRAQKTYHHGDLRAAVLDEVRRIVREHGPGFVSIREVARRARVSHAAPAHHFGSKSGLLTAFATQGYELLAETMRAYLAAAHSSSPPDVVATMGRAYVAFAISHPEHFEIMFPGDLLDRDDPDYIKATDRAYGPFVQAIVRAHAEGYVAADPTVVAAAAWSLVHGLASLWLSGRVQARTGATDAAKLTAAITELFVDSVMRPKPESRSLRAKT